MYFIILMHSSKKTQTLRAIWNSTMVHFQAIFSTIFVHLMVIDSLTNFLNVCHHWKSFIVKPIFSRTCLALSVVAAATSALAAKTAAACSVNSTRTSPRHRGLTPSTKWSPNINQGNQSQSQFHFFMFFSNLLFLKKVRRSPLYFLLL